MKNVYRRGPLITLRTRKIIDFTKLTGAGALTEDELLLRLIGGGLLGGGPLAGGLVLGNGGAGAICFSCLPFLLLGGGGGGANRCFCSLF